MKKMSFILIAIVLSARLLCVAESASITQVSHGFSPIAQKMQSIFDSTVEYIKSKINYFMMIVNGPPVEQISASETITFKDYGSAIPQAALDLVVQLKDRAKDFYIPATKGILLYGPSEDKNKLLARAIAGEVGCPFFAVTGISISNSVVAHELITKAATAARTNSTGISILFIDGIEQVKAGYVLLTEMLNRGAVIIIGGTSSIHNIDHSFRQPGRFDYAIEVP